MKNTEAKKSRATVPLSFTAKAIPLYHKSTVLKKRSRDKVSAGQNARISTCVYYLSSEQGLRIAVYYAKITLVN